jgi:hypothetical protein
MAVTRPPALPTDKPVSPLARLHRERTVIMGELAVLNVSAAAYDKRRTLKQPYTGNLLI